MSLAEFRLGKGSLNSYFHMMWRAHNRLGKVAHDRPKIKASQDETYATQVMLYDLFNPVRAKIIPNPTHVKWRLFSTARYMAYGETNEFTCMITLPEWYMRLGKTSPQRQRKFRQMLDRYAVDNGLKKNPKKARVLIRQTAHEPNGTAFTLSHSLE